MLLSSFYIPFALPDLLNHVTFGLIMLLIFLSIIFYIGVVGFYEALHIENPSLVGTIDSSFVALTVILSLVFLKESITFYQLLFIALIFLGVVACSLDFRLLQQGKLHMSRGIILALIAMVAFGVYFTFLKVAIKQIGWFWPLYISDAFFPLLYLYMKRKRIPLYSPNHKGALKSLLTACVILSIGTFSFNIAIQRGLTAIVVPIGGAYPVVFVILAFLIFKEKITKQQLFGITATLFGIVLLSLFSR